MSKSSHRQSPGNKKVNSPISEDGNLTSEKSRRSPSGERGQRRRNLILDTAADLLAQGAQKLSTPMP